MIRLFNIPSIAKIIAEHGNYSVNYAMQRIYYILRNHPGIRSYQIQNNKNIIRLFDQQGVDEIVELEQGYARKAPTRTHHSRMRDDEI
jgi:hypothetical protein